MPKFISEVVNDALPGTAANRQVCPTFSKMTFGNGANTVKIGVISDTHNFLDPRIPELFAGVEHILHGGDIGDRSLLVELEQIAPVTAVSGNTDCDPLYRATQLVELAGRKFLLHHIVTPGVMRQSIHRQIAVVQPDVVIFGHTHKPFAERIDGTLFFNPGYAGRQRFDLPRSLGIIECDAQLLDHRFLLL